MEQKDPIVPGNYFICLDAGNLSTNTCPRFKSKFNISFKRLIIPGRFVPTQKVLCNILELKVKWT